MNPLKIPQLSLVVMVGPSGSGKSTFARKHFKATEILSSDWCRGIVRDDENDQGATGDAFDVLRFIARKRLAAGRLTVVDATNVQREARRDYVALAREFHFLPAAIVLNIPERVCHERNRSRPDRDFGSHVIRNQVSQLRRSLRSLRDEGFSHVYVLDSVEAVEEAAVERVPLWTDKRDDHGPFDIIGDVHGCWDELHALLVRLGYEIGEKSNGASYADLVARHPDGRKLVFLGDLVDRGPNVVDVLRLVIGTVDAGAAICVPGNHEYKLLKKLRGKPVRISHGMAETLAQLEAQPPDFSVRVEAFIGDLVSHYVLDDGKLVVAHAGMKEEMQGRGSGAVRAFAHYGETTGETDDYGLPVRYNWAQDYRGRAMVVYGHTPVLEPEWLNRTICIDTGCVFGGKLTALRYPERETVSVVALRMYYEPLRPLAAAASGLSAQQESDDLLDLADVSGKRIITTQIAGSVTLREENTAAALEAMSRFAIDPKWLLYLPPTMSPSETSSREGMLEHPEEAFQYFHQNGVAKLVCEEKHMGSRAVLVVCRDEDAARRRLGARDGRAAVCYTRTGRTFFSDRELEVRFLDRVRQALGASGIWQSFGTDWVVMDAEILPWSAKAQELVRTQYASTAAAARASLAAAREELGRASARGANVAELLDRTLQRVKAVEGYAAAYRGYCWPVETIEDLKLAPFHLLATEGAVHVDKDHLWHMRTLHDLCRHDEQILRATPFRAVDVGDRESEAAACAWWEELTERGGEGMVVKPLEFAPRGPRGAVQPAIKCRGPEYLRIIYGPEYRIAANLSRLRTRGLSTKRALAIREFALGIEALKRFVAREPLRRVHECVFGVLALESEPVDPRL